MDTIAPPVPQQRIKRRYRTADERRRIVEETLAAGVSVATVARAHGVNANQVFGWRKLYQAGLLRSIPAASFGEARTSCVRLLPVAVADAECEQPQATLAASAPDDVIRGSAGAAPGTIEVTLAKAQLRIAGHVDASALRVVLECLLG